MISYTLKKMLDEAIIQKMVVRDGKPVKVYQSTRPGYKIQDGVEIRVSLDEKLNRQKGIVKAVPKRDAIRDASNDKQKGSAEIREKFVDNPKIKRPLRYSSSQSQQSQTL